MWRTLGLVLIVMQVSSIFLHKEVEPQQQFCIQDDIRKYPDIQQDTLLLELIWKHTGSSSSSSKKD